MKVARFLWVIIIKDYARHYVLIGICGLAVVVALLEGINMGLLVPLLETMDSGSDHNKHWVTSRISTLLTMLGLSYNLLTVLIVLAVLFLCTSFLKYLLKAMIVKEREGFIVWLRSRSMNILLDSELSYFHQEKIGDLTDTLTTQTSRAGSTISNLIEIIASVGIATTYLVTSFLIAPLLSTIALGLVMVIIIGMRWYIAKAKYMSTVRVERENILLSAVVEIVSGIHVVKSFVLENQKKGDFNQKAVDAGDIGYDIGKNLVNMSVIQEIALFGLVASLVYVGISTLGMGIAVLVALLFILYRLAPQVSGLNAKRQALAVAIGSLQAVDSANNRAISLEILDGSVPFLSLSHGIEVKDVDFSYTEGTTVLNKTRFSIEKNKMTAITGLSGSGKSTLIELILRYHDPDSGTILIDGRDIKDFQIASWRECTGVVSQDVFLFNDSIFNNISLNRANVTVQAVEEAAQKAYAHDFIMQFPDGYDTQIGDRGWNLSGGQRQRLALARAILQNPGVLILDEATSSLDSESETWVKDYVESIKGLVTIVIVSHRMSTIQDADKIIVIEDGSVIETGEWDVLMEKDGVLANLYRFQSTS